MRIQAELNATDKIVVKATDKRYCEFIVTLGDIEITLNRTDSEILHCELEEELFDKDSWSRNVEDRADKLQKRVDELEEYISNYGWEIPA